MCRTDSHLWQGHYDLGTGRGFSPRDRGIEPPVTQRTLADADANAALDLD